MTYRISEAAAKMKVAPSTLRFYDKHGLLPFVQRDDHGNRVFTDNDLNYLEVITALKNSGVHIDTIAEFIQLNMQGDATLSDRYAYLKDEGTRLEAHIQTLQTQLAFLKFKQWYYETAIAAGTEAIHFKPGTTDFDPYTKQKYLDTHPQETLFQAFLD